MYYAQMYCYGKDANDVGITGILGCLGIVFTGAQHAYAVHIPPGAPNRELAGAMAFMHMIIADLGANPAGSLHFFVNGRNRTDVDAEARRVRDGLGGPNTRVYRLMTNLGPQSGTSSALSATIRVRRNGLNFNMDFGHVPDNEWIAGGAAKSGCYVAMYNGTFGGNVTVNPGAVIGWTQVGAPTCNIRGIH